MQFPDFIHSQKPDPCTNIKNYAHVWDFFSLTPESLHQLMWLYSDRGIVKDFAKMDGFGVNTFVWVNGKGERFYVKYRFTAQEPFDIINWEIDSVIKTHMLAFANGEETLDECHDRIVEECNERLDDYHLAND